MKQTSDDYDCCTALPLTQLNPTTMHHTIPWPVPHPPTREALERTRNVRRRLVAKTKWSLDPSFTRDVKFYTIVLYYFRVSVQFGMFFVHKAAEVYINMRLWLSVGPTTRRKQEHDGSDFRRTAYISSMRTFGGRTTLAIEKTLKSRKYATVNHAHIAAPRSGRRVVATPGSDGFTFFPQLAFAHILSPVSREFESIFVHRPCVCYASKKGPHSMRERWQP